MAKGSPELAHLLPGEPKGVDPGDELLLEVLLHTLPCSLPPTSSRLLHLLPDGVAPQQGVGAPLHHELHHVLLLGLRVWASPCLGRAGQDHLMIKVPFDFGQIPEPTKSSSSSMSDTFSPTSAFAADHVDLPRRTSSGLVEEEKIPLDLKLDVVSKQEMMFDLLDPVVGQIGQDGVLSYTVSHVFGKEAVLSWDFLDV